ARPRAVADLGDARDDLEAPLPAARDEAEPAADVVLPHRERAVDRGEGRGRRELARARLEVVELPVRVRLEGTVVRLRQRVRRVPDVVRRLRVPVGILTERVDDVHAAVARPGPERSADASEPRRLEAADRHGLRVEEEACAAFVESKLLPSGGRNEMPPRLNRQTATRAVPAPTWHESTADEGRAAGRRGFARPAEARPGRRARSAEGLLSARSSPPSFQMESRPRGIRESPGQSGGSKQPGLRAARPRRDGYDDAKLWNEHSRLRAGNLR